MALKQGDKVATRMTDCWDAITKRRLYLTPMLGVVSSDVMYNADVSFQSVVEVTITGSDPPVDGENPEEIGVRVVFPVNSVSKLKVRRAELVKRIEDLESRLEQLETRLRKAELKLKYVPWIVNGVAGTPWEHDEEEEKEKTK